MTIVNPGAVNGYRVFFSHGGEDTYIVKDFLKPKIEESGATVFVDSGEITYGDDFRKTVFVELKQCHELLVLFTRSSIKRPWIFAELGASYMRAVRVVVINYGVTENELQSDGILSLIGTNNILRLNDFDSYIAQLKSRVKGELYD